MTTAVITKRMIREVREKYKAKRVVRFPKKNPTRVVFEISRSANNRSSVALVLITETRPHFHANAYELLKVVDGELNFFATPGYLPPPPTRLAKGDKVIIRPATDHWSSCVGGVPALVKVVSQPAWSHKDYHLAGK